MTDPTNNVYGVEVTRIYDHWNWERSPLTLTSSDPLYWGSNLSKIMPYFNCAFLELKNAYNLVSGRCPSRTRRYLCIIEWDNLPAGD